jgi:hypothetical protein
MGQLRTRGCNITYMGERSEQIVFARSWEGDSLSAVFKSNEIWDPAVHGERRSGNQRRARDTSTSEQISWFDDRRLGLGRRWDDWRRPQRTEDTQS